VSHADPEAAPPASPTPTPDGDAPSGSRGAFGLRLVGPALAGVAVLLAALAHHGLCPAVGGEAPAWYHPRGFLRDALPGLGLIGPERTVPALLVPMAGLAVAVFLTTRSALARTLAVASALAVALFAYYAQRLSIVWEFYGGHWSATLVLFAGVAAGALCAVWLTRSWQRLPWPARVAVYLPVFVFLLAFERNVTGTDPALRFALSPWPLVQVFALETFATGVAMLLLGVGAGLLLLTGLASRAGLPVAALVAGAVAVAFPVASLGVGSTLGLLPFQQRAGMLELMAFLAALVFAGAVLLRRGGVARLGPRGRLFATAALLLGMPLLLGQTLTRLDYAETRDVRARRIIEALDAYYAREQTYPDDLATLVEAGDLGRVPAPRIGFAWLERPEFRYDSFGTSYMLEFAAPRWIQCQYNPPWEDDLSGESGNGGNGAGESEDAYLQESWSCPSNPPELW